jgi:hypothetical protein
VPSLPHEPSVSVVVAVHDGARFIARALASILSQTAPAAEVLVVDDGSTDGTAEVVARFPAVHLLRRRDNRGQAAALNWGVARAAGSHLAFLDADDVWEPDKLERQLAALAADPALDVVYGQARQRGAVMPACLPSAMLVSRAAFVRVGGFDGGFRVGSVVDWYARSRAAGLRERVLDVVVYERVIHGENTGIKRREDQSEYLRVVRGALARRRAAGVAPAAPVGPALALSESQRLVVRALCDPAAPELAGAHRENEAQAALVVAQAARAQQRLETAEIRALVTGGVALLGFYPAGRLGCRPIDGAELVVERDSAAAAAEALRALGPPASPPLDLRLVPIGAPAFARALTRAERRDVHGVSLICAGASDLARDVCVDAWGGGAPSADLGWVADLVYLARAGVDCRRLEEEARASGAGDAVVSALAVLRDLGD